jgi:hypothetical protein
MLLFIARICADTVSVSTMTIKKEMNGYWLVGQWRSEKTKTMPEMKGTMMWGYNVVDKKSTRWVSTAPAR